jgi:alkanesulfonate monooxygenase SsuD/methylene tetrahydromethanopterin reductase-like flavin-dependent oxidoreductase (luciferase family)
MRRCARYGDGWLPYMYTPERLADSLATIGQFSEDEDRSEVVKPGLYLFFAVHEDQATGLRMATDRLSVQYNQDFSKLVGKYALAGNPDDCIARLREYIDAGARTIILNSACPGEYVEENERLLAQSVLPALRNAP